MKRKRNKIATHKAASAALAIFSVATAAAIQAPGTMAPPEGRQTIPHEANPADALNRIKTTYHFQLAETPLLLKEFLAEYPASAETAEARLLLGNWYFFNGEYPTASKWYSEIPDDAFSGDVREAMLYRKALSLLKTGYYAEAGRYFNALSSSREFGLDSRFYSAYISYVNSDYTTAYRRFKDLLAAGGARTAEAEYYINQIDYNNGEYTKVAQASKRLLASGNVPPELKGETMRVGGISYFKTGDKAAARQMLKDYAAYAGDGAEISALYTLGTIYYDEGDYSKALPLFTTVTEYPGELAQSSWLYIGQIHLAQGDPQGAALAFDKAARESWNGSVAETAAYNLAVGSTEGPALPFSDAAAIMENFIASYPASPYSSSLSAYLANAYYSQRDYENALRQADKITPRDAATVALRQKILYQLGAARLRAGDADGAIKALAEASSPSMPDREVAAQSALWLGDAYYSKGAYQNAAKAYSDAIERGATGENTGLAYYDLGYAYLKMHRYKQAEAAFKTASTSGQLPRQLLTDARLRYADCLYYNGKYADALGIFRDIKLNGGPDSAFARIREADIMGKDGKVAEKISILEGLLNSDDTGIWKCTVVERLADAYSEKGDDRRAAELYAMLLDNPAKGGDTSQAYYSLAANADNLLAAGDLQAAYNAYKRLEASGIEAIYPQAVTGIMQTSQNPEEIYEYAAKALTLPGLPAEETDRAVYMGAVAGLSLGGRRHDEAVAALGNLARSADRLWGARAAVTLGEQLLKENRPAEAEEVLTYLVDNGSDDSYWMARGYIALADAYAAQDKDYLARLYLESLKSNYPGGERDILQMIDTRLKTLDK